MHLHRSTLRARVPAALAGLVLLLAGCAEAAPLPQQASPTPYRFRPPMPAGRGPLVVAAGDLVCAPGSKVTATECRDRAASRLAAEYDPDYVFALGDEQYGTPTRAAYQRGYAKTWGKFKAITRPVPGNHEYDGKGYFAYFRKQTRPPGYYAFDVGRWRIYAINDNCTKIDCAAELGWMERDMQTHPRRCSAIMMHQPLYASGIGTGGHPETARPFWRVALRHGADLSLAAHLHHYERFRPMGLRGRANATGMTSFVSGAGGASVRPLTAERARGSEAFENAAAGVLALRLGKGRFSWTYRTVGGRDIDSGARACS